MGYGDSHVMDKQGIATDNYVRRNGKINREDRKQNKPNTRLMDISSKPNQTKPNLN